MTPSAAADRALWTTVRGGWLRPWPSPGSALRPASAQPRAWLNWPQIASGCQRSGSPRIRRGACHDSVQPRREQPLEPGLVLCQEPARILCSGPRPTRRACRIASASSRRGAIVAPPPHGARTTKPPTARRRPRGRSPSRARRRRPADAPGPRRSRRRRGRPSRPGRPPGTAGSAGRRPRRRGPAPRGSDTRSGPRSRAARRAAGRRRWRPGRASGSRPPRRRRSWPGSAPSRRHAAARRGRPRSCRSSRRSVDAHDAGPDDLAVGLGHERLRLRCRVTKSRLSRRSPQSSRRNAADDGSTSAGVMGRMRGSCHDRS